MQPGDRGVGGKLISRIQLEVETRVELLAQREMASMAAEGDGSGLARKEACSSERILTPKREVAGAQVRSASRQLNPSAPQ
jgi:hypothetical protein